jgi:penicillin-binding protein 1A
VAGVWFGFDRPKAILADASGGGLAAPVWGRVVADHYRRHPAPAPWNAPPDLQARQIDRRSGHLATPNCPLGDVRTEYFLSGTEPTESCPLHGEAAEGDSWVDPAPDDGSEEPPPQPRPVPRQVQVPRR